MPGDGDFFDDFGDAPAGGTEAPLFSDEEFEAMRALFLEPGLSAADLAARYRALFDAALAAQGRSIDWARAAHADYPYVRAYDDAEVLAALRAEAAAAAANVVEEKEVWHPPPPDEQPETAHDYE